MALAKRNVKKSKALSKAEMDPMDSMTDEEKMKAKAKADAEAMSVDKSECDMDDKDGEDMDKADGDMDEQDNSDDGDDMDEDGDSDEDMPIGEFRVEVMPNGMVRIHKDDLADDDDSEDDDQAEKSDDDMMQADCNQNEGMEMSMGKSTSAKHVAVTEDSLKKALKTLMSVAKASEGGNSLMQRAQSAEGITKSEAKALFGKVAKGARRSASLGESVAKSFTEDRALSQAHGQTQDSDVGDYLEALTERTAKSQAMLADTMEGSVQQLTAQNERYHSVMAKALGQSLATLKLISERMGVIEAQPTRAPKSLSAQPVEAARKSFAGSAPNATLSKAEMLDTLTRMNLDSMKSGRQGMSKGHRPLMNGIEAAMNDQAPDAGLLEEVISFRQASV
jgi:hypothetical protein